MYFETVHIEVTLPLVEHSCKGERHKCPFLSKDHVSPYHYWSCHLFGFTLQVGKVNGKADEPVMCYACKSRKTVKTVQKT